jgi:hypothetical protein
VNDEGDDGEDQQDVDEKRSNVKDYESCEPSKDEYQRDDEEHKGALSLSTPFDRALCEIGCKSRAKVCFIPKSRKAGIAPGLLCVEGGFVMLPWLLR